MCMLKNVIVMTITMMVLLGSSVYAKNAEKVTKDLKLQEAVRIIENTGSANLINSLVKNRIQIRFYDLSLLSFEYAKHYAMRVDTSAGKQYILINSKFESAPTEAIACLVAHEAVHNLPNATFAEEVMATSVEAKTWIQVRNNVDYENSTNPLVKRLNRNAERYLLPNGIANSIAKNATYKKQFNL